MNPVMGSHWLLESVDGERELWDALNAVRQQFLDTGICPMHPVGKLCVVCDSEWEWFAQ